MMRAGRDATPDAPPRPLARDRTGLRFGVCGAGERVSDPPPAWAVSVRDDFRRHTTGGALGVVRKASLPGLQV